VRAARCHVAECRVTNAHAALAGLSALYRMHAYCVARLAGAVEFATFKRKALESKFRHAYTCTARKATTQF
jgi:hypothetical protein